MATFSCETEGTRISSSQEWDSGLVVSPDRLICGETLGNAKLPRYAKGVQPFLRLSLCRCQPMGLPRGFRKLVARRAGEYESHGTRQGDSMAN